MKPPPPCDPKVRRSHVPPPLPHRSWRPEHVDDKQDGRGKLAAEEFWARLGI